MFKNEAQGAGTGARSGVACRPRFETRVHVSRHEAPRNRLEKVDRRGRARVPLCAGGYPGPLCEDRVFPLDPMGGAPRLV